MDRPSVVESELPGAGAGATSLAPSAVVGATAADVVGDTAIGERAAPENKRIKSTANCSYTWYNMRTCCISSSIVNKIHLIFLHRKCNILMVSNPLQQG